MGRKKNTDNDNNARIDPATITFEMLKDKIDLACIEYEQSLPDGSGLNQINVFNGMIYAAGTAAFNNINTCELDINLLDKVFNYYTYLCCKYNKHPYMIQFCLFINISDNTFNHWMNGARQASMERMAICKKWVKTCEQSQLSDQGVKSMFLLKAVYGYVEASQPITIQHEIRTETTNLINKYKEYPQLMDNKPTK